MFADTLYYFPSADDETYEGFVRIINHADDAGEVAIVATDDHGNTHDSFSVNIGALETITLTSDEIEQGDEQGNFTGVGDGEGDWRLEITSELPIEVLPYIRKSDDALVPVHATIPLITGQYRIPSFSVRTEDRASSHLRVVNESDEEAQFTISATDESSTEDEATLTVPGYHSLNLSASDLVSGEAPDSWSEDVSIDDSIDLENGLWELVINGDTDLIIMHLMTSASDEISNHSTLPAQWWRGLRVEAELRCAGADYDRDEYGRRYSSKKDDILDELGANFGPYSGNCFSDDDETHIEHIVAIAEAHESGMCQMERETKRTFAGDILNLTIAAAKVNLAKSSKDAYDWIPDQNSCWFADRVVQVRQKYGMTVDPDEANALEDILANCETVEMVKPDCSD